jgi:hypothetical protein
MSLLYSCVFTLFLCVCTAVHLNVPPENEGKFAFYRRKTKWVLIALLAPEVVLYTAWSQWRDARWLAGFEINGVNVTSTIAPLYHVCR